jgi:hypothetical protein
MDIKLYIVQTTNPTYLTFGVHLGKEKSTKKEATRELVRMELAGKI